MNINKSQTLSEQFDQLSTNDLLQNLRESGSLDRAHAMNALTRRSVQDPTLLNHVVEAVVDSRNLNAKLMGTISVSHMGIHGMLKAGTHEAKEAAKLLLERWPEPDRSDLLDFLRSEGLSVDDIKRGYQAIVGAQSSRV